MIRVSHFILSIRHCGNTTSEFVFREPDVMSPKVSVTTKPHHVLFTLA